MLSRQKTPNHALEKCLSSLDDINPTTKELEKIELGQIAEKENPGWFSKIKDYGIKFLYPNKWKVGIAGGLSLAYLGLGALDHIGYHIEERHVDAGPKEQRNYALVFNRLFHWFDHHIGRGEIIYTEIGEEGGPSINIPNEVTTNCLWNALPFTVPAYLTACILVEVYNLAKHGSSRLNEYGKRVKT